MSERQPAIRSVQLSGTDAQRFRNRLSNPFLRERERALARIVVDTLPKGKRRVLEVGCGEGNNAAYVMPEISGVFFVGADISADKVKFMNCQVPGAMAVAGDALRLPFRDAAFDLVLCRDLLHHVYWDQPGVLTEAARVLVPGGSILVIEADGRKPLNRLFRLLCERERGMAKSDPVELRRVCGVAGKVEESRVEATFLVRALGYVVGWPSNPWRLFVAPLYCLASAYDKLMGRLLPQDRWTYMLFRIRKEI